MIEYLRRHTGFILYVGAKSVGALTTLCVAGLVSRSLGPGPFGFLMNTSVIAMVLAAIVDGNVMARGISRWQSDSSNFAGWLVHAVAFRLAAGLLCLIVLLLICLMAKWTDYLVLSAGWCLFLILQPFRLLEIRLIASEDFNLLSRATLWSCGGILVLGVILFAIGWTRLVWVSLCLLVLPVMGSSPYLIFTRKALPGKPGALQEELLKREAGITFSFGITQGMSMLLDTLPYLVLPRFHSYVVLGWYAVVSKLVQTYTQGIALLLPYALTKLNRARQAKMLKFSFYALLLGAFSLLAFTLFGTQAIVLINGSAFAKAGTLILPLTGLILVIPLGQLCMGMAGLAHKPRLPFLTVSLTFALLGILLYLFRPESAHGFLTAYSIAILATTLWFCLSLCGFFKRGESRRSSP